MSPPSHSTVQPLQTSLQRPRRLHKYSPQRGLPHHQQRLLHRAIWRFDPQVVRIIDMPAGTSSPMHGTVSLDFGVVLKGEVVLEPDDDGEVTFKEQSAVVQRGAIHAWYNRTKEISRILFMLLPPEKLRVERPGEELGGEGIPTDGLAP